MLLLPGLARGQLFLYLAEGFGIITNLRFKAGDAGGCLRMVMLLGLDCLQCAGDLGLLLFGRLDQQGGWSGVVNRSGFLPFVPQVTTSGATAPSSSAMTPISCLPLAFRV